MMLDVSMGSKFKPGGFKANYSWHFHFPCQQIGAGDLKGKNHQAMIDLPLFVVIPLHPCDT
jgi:hypothetical protein